MPTYDLTYQYDQGGNRTLKIDAENNRTVVYHYDIDDPSVYGSANNRLMHYETYASEPRASARADLDETETFHTTPQSSPLTKGGFRGFSLLPMADRREVTLAPAASCSRRRGTITATRAIRRGS